MKRFLKAMLLLLIISLCVGLIGYSYNFNEIQIRLAGNNADKNQKSLHYHFAVISQDTENDFWQGLKKGAQSAGQEFGAAIEFNGTVIRNEDEELEYLNIAIASHVDGIAIFVTNDAMFTPQINKAISNKIPVVTIESDDKSSNRIAYVGPNSFNAGSKAGALVADAMNGTSNVALILSGNYTGDTDAKNKLLSGFQFGIGASPGIRLQAIQTSDTGYFGAEKTMRDILNNYPDINTIVCTSVDDTLEISQVLIDLNKVGKIAVIGYNNVSQIRDYIKKGVIYGSVVEDPEKTGYQSIKALVSSLKGQKTEDFIDTGVYTITRSNILNYPSNS